MAQHHTHETRHFPDGFQWGVSTAAHQFEGNNTNSDWWQWEKIPGRIQDGSVSGPAVDHYHRYEEDLDLCAAMHNNSHRLSIEWARIEPRHGEWDEQEIAHYAEVLAAAKKRGMTVMLTVWHFTLPKWFVDKGGWEHPLSVIWFTRYVKLVAERLGAQVDLWNTMNEPNVYVSQGYLSGGWPPGVKSALRSQFVAWRLTRAHIAAYKAIHAVIPKAQVGMAQNVLSIEAYNLHSFVDYIGTRVIDWYWNHLYHAFTRKYHDFIGINYYFHFRLKKFGWPPTTFFAEVRRERRDTSDVGWELNPAGIFRVLVDFQRYRLPIYITENGLPSTNDDRRKRLIVATLKEVFHAINAGIDIRGYYFWSLLDNFEWEKGYAAKFGLCEFDRQTGKKTPRGSYSVFAEICKANGLPHEMLRYIGHAVDQPYEHLKTGVHAHEQTDH
jgi:beta-glucosidase